MLSGHDFYPFGMEVAESGQAAGGPSRMKFTGHERDDLTGLDYMKARYSGWFQASFLIPDPANDVNPRNPQSWNRYAYVRNNPMNLVDPEGLQGKIHSHQNQQEAYESGACGPGQTAANCDTTGSTEERVEASTETAEDANQTVFERAATQIEGAGQSLKAAGDELNDGSALGVLADAVLGTVGDMVSGAGDTLRVGSATGEAIGEGAGGEQIARSVAQDVGRGSALALAMAVPANGLVRGGAGAGATTSSQSLGANPFKGKSADSVAGMLERRGYIPRGSDPATGRGTYVNPRTGRGYHIDAGHGPPKGPHVGVHRPRGLRDTLPPRDYPMGGSR
jgi:RHS repeat-associated protein